ncbi:hypothetical protein K469DRAFT_610138, partial [Zopfia rhizophila CBS 207.26]
GLKIVNKASYIALNVIINKIYLGYYISINTIFYLSLLAGILLIGKLIKNLHLVNIPPGTILLTLISMKIEY